MSPFNQITAHKQLSIRTIDNFELRIKSGEKKRDVEKTETIQSLKELGFDSEIAYKSTGQPYLVKHESLHLSISHSKGWIAVWVAEQPIGIDIEPNNPKIIDGTTYFVNENEQQFLGNLSALHVIWGAKEAFYKLMEGQISDLKNEVSIIKIGEQNGQLSFGNEIIEFYYAQENEVTFVWVTN